MIQRFLENQDTVHTVLKHFKKEEHYPTPRELTILSDIYEALDIVEASSRKLCQRDISLADADKVQNLFQGNFFKKIA